MILVNTAVIFDQSMNRIVSESVFRRLYDIFYVGEDYERPYGARERFSRGSAPDCGPLLAAKHHSVCIRGTPNTLCTRQSRHRAPPGKK